MRNFSNASEKLGLRDYNPETEKRPGLKHSSSYEKY
jgi:hypothetical protein